MSWNPMDRVATMSERCADTAPCYRLGLSAAGWWALRETAGRKAGLFRTRTAAIKYAHDESPKGIFTIIYEPDGSKWPGPEHATLGSAT